MSTFEDSRYRWRETYFVFFDARKRPKMSTISKSLRALNSRFQLTNLSEEEDGDFDSLTLVSPDDYAALDICYTEGAEVTEQLETQIMDLKKAGLDIHPPIPWNDIKRFDCRFDVLHFEQVPEDVSDDEDDGMLDPSALLIVLETLAKITGGVAIDPQSGTFLSEE